MRVSAIRSRLAQSLQSPDSQTISVQLADGEFLHLEPCIGRARTHVPAYRAATLLLPLLPLLVPFAFAADPNEEIKVPCEEFRRLTGAKLPCDAYPVLTMKRSHYAAAKISSDRKTCRERVAKKYGKWIRLTADGAITQDEPPASSEEPWMSCGLMRQWHPENHSYDCFDELEACKQVGKEKPKPAPEPTVKLF